MYALGSCLGIVIFAIISLIVAFTISVPEELGKYDRRNIISQIKEDWTAKPFVEIDGFEGACPEGWDPVFERVWKGIEEGCRLTYKYNTGKKY